MSEPAKKQSISSTAEYWFNSARTLQEEGKLAEALMAMEQAFNQAEGNAFATARALKFMNGCIEMHKGHGMPSLKGDRATIYCAVNMAETALKNLKNL